ncbi:hypothetical protein ACT7C8_15105 [Bacillus cereus]
MIIRAEGIIDIRNDSPREGDVFLLTQMFGFGLHMIEQVQGIRNRWYIK